MVWCGVGVWSHSYLQYIVTDMRTLIRSQLTKPRGYFCPRNEAVETKVLKYRQYIMIGFSHFKKLKCLFGPYGLSPMFSWGTQQNFDTIFEGVLSIICSTQPPFLLLLDPILLDSKVNSQDSNSVSLDLRSPTKN